ncbi:hypothetical protein [Spiroplasma endosymbiont of Dactylopius coccus]|nr:hypothetical protein [Spiroplasma ixodetis]
MNNGNIVINEFYLFQKNKEKKKEYTQRSEVKVRRRKYDREWYHKNKEKKENMLKCLKWKKKRQYAQRPKVKARRKEYKKIRQQLNKQEKEKQRELQSDYVFSSKQNFDLSNFNCDDMCSEQIKNIAWDVLESQLYSETQETELDKLLEKIEFEYMANEEQSSVLSSENLSSNLIFDGMCDEQIIKDISNNLELDQSIEQLLLSEKIAEQNFEWNNSILCASNLDNDIYDYNSVTRFIP